MSNTHLMTNIDELAALVPDGATVAMPGDRRGVSMAIVKALIRRSVRGLHLINVPTGNIETDMLIGAGCIEELTTSGVSLGEYGRAPNFCKAVIEKRIRINESSCPAIHSALQASEKGVPFMPIRGILGSDILNNRHDWKVIDNPMQPGEPIVVIPAIKPDIAIFHTHIADIQGNIWVGRERDLVTIAHASVTSLVSVEKLQKNLLYENEYEAAGTLSSLYIGHITESRFGAWPLAQPNIYETNQETMRAYAAAAGDPFAFKVFLEQHLAEESYLRDAGQHL